MTDKPRELSEEELEEIKIYELARELGKQIAEEFKSSYKDKTSRTEMTKFTIREAVHKIHKEMIVGANAAKKQK